MRRSRHSGLGSNSVVADSSGAFFSEVRYTPFGATRYTSGLTPTDYLYTGQREHAELGLYFYNARWYDPSIGHFVQADTIIPGVFNPMAFDRFSYVFNSPIVFADPSGNVPDIHCADGYKCIQRASPRKPPAPLLIFEAEEGQEWKLEEIEVITAGAWDVANAYADEMNYEAQKLTKLGEIEGYVPITPLDAFHKVHDGPVRVVRKDGTCAEEIGSTYPDCGGWAFANSQNEIWVFTNASTEDIVTHPRLIVHELGHAFENAIDDNGYDKPRYDLPADVLNRNGFFGPALSWQLSTDLGSGEIFADMFVGWVYGKWEVKGGRLSPQAALKASFMNDNMGTFINLSIP